MSKSANSKMTDQWYAIFVKTGTEDRTMSILRNKFHPSMKFYVPKREMKIRRQGKYFIENQLMFPGYILADGILSDDIYSVVQHLENVFTFISDFNGPLVIKSEEVALIKRLIDDRDIINTSKVYYEGDKIVVIDGPLLGNEAIIQKIDRRNGRVRVVIPFLSSTKMIDLSIECINKDNI